MGLLVSGVVTPAQADASCGDYVVIPGEHRPMPSPRPADLPVPTSDALNPTGVDHPPVPGTPVCSPCRVPRGPDPAGRLPCEGPSCSGPPLPVAPPTSTYAPDRQERWDCLLPVSPPDHPDTGAPWQRDGLSTRIHRPSSVFHPPRSC